MSSELSGSVLIVERGGVLSVESESPQRCGGGGHKQGEGSVYSIKRGESSAFRGECPEH